MKKTNILVAVAVAASFSIFYPTQVSAKVDGYVVKDSTNQVYQYDKSQLEQSYINNRLNTNHNLNLDEKLYDDYKQKNNGSQDMYLLHDDTHKYVDYSAAKAAFQKNTGNFNLDKQTEAQAKVDPPAKINKARESSGTIVNDTLLPKDGTTFDTNNTELPNDMYVEGNNISVSNATVGGTLYVNPGSNGVTTLNTVTAKNISVLSGGQNSIHMENVKSDTVSVKSSSPVRVAVSGATNIGSTSVGSSAILDVSAGTLGNIKIDDSEADKTITFIGSFDKSVEVDGQATLNTGINSKIDNLIVAPGLSDYKIVLDGKFGNVAVNNPAAISLTKNALISGTFNIGAGAALSSAAGASIANLVVDSAADSAEIDVKGAVSIGKLINNSNNASVNLDKYTLVSQIQSVNEDAINNQGTQKVITPPSGSVYYHLIIKDSKNPQYDIFKSCLGVDTNLDGTTIKQFVDNNLRTLIDRNAIRLDKAWEDLLAVTDVDQVDNEDVPETITAYIDAFYDLFPGNVYDTFFDLISSTSDGDVTVPEGETITVGNITKNAGDKLTIIGAAKVLTNNQSITTLDEAKAAIGNLTFGEIKTRLNGFYDGKILISDGYDSLTKTADNTLQFTGTDDTTYTITLF